MRERLFCMALLVLVGGVTYLCASHAGFLNIDDIGMVHSVSSDSFTLKSLFLGGASQYYRPLAVISYAANASLFGLSPVSFHVINVAIHIVNALLVYWLALELLGEETSLIAALFFLVSPLNSETATWVSARPDLLCAFFFLLALILMVKRERLSAGSLFCFCAAYLASLCSKEASIALFGIAPVYLLWRRRDGRVKEAAWLAAGTVATTALYAFLRTGKRAALDAGASSVASNVVTRSADHPSLLDGVGAYGFYLKKLVYPFPLNFTILRYDRGGSFLALGLALIAALYLVRRHKEALLPLLIVFIGIGPPVLAYLGRIPWTPFGERYLYLPMIGFSLLVGLLVGRWSKVPRIVPVAAVLLLAVPTIFRVSLWCDRTAFWNDALAKSPGFAKSHSALGAIALEEQRYDEAERQIRMAISNGMDEPTIWENLARVHAARKEYGKYEEAMVKAAKQSPRPTGIYQELIGTLMGARGAGSRDEIYAKAIRYHLQALKRDSSYLEAYYNVGKLYLALGDRVQAQRYLVMYTEKAQRGYFRPFAEKMIRNIAAADRV